MQPRWPALQYLIASIESPAFWDALRSLVSIRNRPSTTAACHARMQLYGNFWFHEVSAREKP
jgi:hypothetical protein